MVRLNIVLQTCSVAYQVYKFSEGHVIDGPFVSFFVCLVCFGQNLRCTDKRIVKIMKVYIERNNLQLE